jgi:hypothetical protein
MNSNFLVFRKGKLFILSVVAAVTLGIFSGHAFAYYDAPYHVLWWKTKFSTNQYQLTWKYHQRETRNWYNDAIYGVVAWNSSNARVLVTKIPDSSTATPNITFFSLNWGNTGWHGQAVGPDYIHWTSHSEIKLNDHYWDAAGSNRAELAAHEMGHSFRLDDVEPSYNTLMRGAGYNGSSSPTSSDVQGVNESY